MWHTTGFDVGDLSEDAPDDIEGLDAAAAHVANLLSTEPADSMFPLANLWGFMMLEFFFLFRQCFHFSSEYLGFNAL